MEKLANLSFGLLSISLTFLLLLIAGYLLNSYINSPLLFIPPPEIEEFSYVERLKNSKNLEGIKRACVIWAKQEDHRRLSLNSIIEQQGTNTNILFIFLLLFLLSLTGVVFKMHLMIKRLKYEQSNKL